MTTRPGLSKEVNWAAGAAAVALFGVLAAVFLTAEIPAPAGFESGSITASIGYAMFNLADMAAHESEGFLVAFIIIAIALDAALDGSIMLATREEREERTVPDGGQEYSGGED